TNSANGVLFAAKRPFAFRCATPPGAANGALLVADFDQLRMMAAYFPQKKLKAPFFQFCMDEAAASHSIPFLLLGDLNTGRNDVANEANGARFDCVDQFKTLPLVDLWRAEHGDTAQEWSWYSRLSPKRRSNGFRIDHAFANAAFRQRFPDTRCIYDHAP